METNETRAEYKIGTEPIEYLISTLVGVRMLAKIEAKLGQTKWAEAVPMIDDAIERGTAEVQRLNTKNTVID